MTFLYPLSLFYIKKTTTTKKDNNKNDSQEEFSVEIAMRRTGLLIIENGLQSECVSYAILQICVTYFSVKFRSNLPKAVPM